MMANPPLDRRMYLTNVGESEFGTPSGYVDPDAYRGKAASESLEHAPPEGIPNGE
jgi:hypothetical protein